MDHPAGSSRGRRPPRRKRFGQHHLVHPHLCRPLLEFLRPAQHRVVEIGPGGGILTRELAAEGATAVWAWELDLDWAFALGRTLATSRVTLVAGDALGVPWERLPAGTLAAGNLPFGVATALIERLLPSWERVPRAGFLVQLEVAERLAASPGDAAYGALSVLAAAHAEVRLLGRVKPGSFAPPPRVEGAFVGLELRPPPFASEEAEDLRKTVHLAFGQRRKILRNALAAGWGREGAEKALERAGIDPTARAEGVSLAGFLALSRARREEGDEEE